MAIRFLPRSLIILPFLFGSFSSKAQSKTFIIHPSVGTSLTYEELEKYHIYPQYKKAAVDSLTYSYNSKGKFFLHLHFSNGVKDYLPVSKKDVYYVHEKINVVDRVHDTLVLENVKLVKIKKVKSTDTIAGERRLKIDSLRKNGPLFMISISSSETDYFSSRGNQINNVMDQIISMRIDKEHFLPDWDFRFTYLHSNKNKSRIFLGIGIWIQRYNADGRSGVGWNPQTIMPTIIERSLKVRETSFNFHFGAKTQWNFFSIFYGLDLNAGSNFGGKYSQYDTEYHLDYPYGNLLYTTYKSYPSQNISGGYWNPSVNLILNFSFKLFEKKNQQICLDIKNKVGGYLKETNRTILSCGLGVHYEF